MSRQATWFVLTTTTQAATIGASKCNVYHVAATQGNVVRGVAPPAGLNDLDGYIEQIVVRAATSVKIKLDVLFFSKTRGLSTAVGTDTYLDHESFVTGDFIGGGINANGTWVASKPVRASKNFLQIPYKDESHLGQFHVGLLNTSGTVITAKYIQVEWGWRSRATGD